MRSSSGHASSSKSSRIRIAVRVRPLSAEEESKGHACIVERVNDTGVRVWDPSCLDLKSSSDRGLVAAWSRDFFYDHCLWSVSSLDSNFANQQSIFEAVGRPVVDFVLDGYNTCVLAYGQTGAGKSYTMLGSSRDTSQYGLIPRICFALFEDLEQSSADKVGHEFSVDFSYLEIYNETLKDCLSPGATKGDLKLRESREGVLVTNITSERVHCFEDVMSLIAHGNKYRTVAATNANARSSRSHAIVTLSVCQRYRSGVVNGLPSSALQQKTSRVHLVDLAGSERQSHSGATGMRLREANNINRSLSVLGDVIKFLGEGRGHVPYRNSMLTMVLKESLGGNSHTAIVANVSPSSSNYDETISTLKYADSAKRIRMRVAANVTSGLGAADGSTAMQLVPLLQAEVAKLKELLKSQESQNLSANRMDVSLDPNELSEGVLEMKARVQELEDQLRDREDLIKSFNNVNESQDNSRYSVGENSVSNSSYLQPLVLLSDDAVDTTVPRIVNLNQDPLFSECLVYYIPDGFATAGSDEGEVDVFLSGPDLLPKHCVFHNHKGVVTIGPLYSASAEDLVEGVGQIFVNGVDLRSATASKRNAHDGHIVRLSHFDRIAIGRFHLFRFEAAGMHRSHNESSSPVPKSVDDATPAVKIPDWEFAQNELMQKSLGKMSNVSPSGLTTSAASSLSNHQAPQVSDEVRSSHGSSTVPTKSILRTSNDESRRVRFSDELVLEKMDKYSKPHDSVKPLSQERPVEVAPILSAPVAATSEKDNGYWSRMDRIVNGTEKAANPAELRSMMRAALEITSNDVMPQVNRYSGTGSSVPAPEKRSATAASTVRAPEYTTSPVKVSPTLRSATKESSVHSSPRSHQGSRAVLTAQTNEKPEEVYRKPKLAPEEVYNVDNIRSLPTPPPKAYSGNIAHNGEKFDNEVLALQSELAQMQKNLQDRMQRYRSMGKRP